MGIQKISYGKNICLKEVKLKVSFSENKLFERLTSESIYSFNELLGYSICRVFNRRKENVFTILENRKNRSNIQNCNWKKLF